MRTFYLLHNKGGGITATVIGPYESNEARDEAAKEFHRSEYFLDNDALLWMDVDATAVQQVEVGSYTGGFFQED